MKRLAAIVLALTVSATAAAAQSRAAFDPTGSFERLTAGDQRTALAIFEAQTTEPPQGVQTLSLDQLAARKLFDRKSWESIYKDLRYQGLVKEQSLGQAMKAFEGRK
jgi:hypothetical protein